MIPLTPEGSLPPFQGMGLEEITSTSSVITHTTTMSGVRSTMASCLTPGLQAPSSIPTSGSTPLGMHLPIPPLTVPSGFAVGHPEYPITLKTHRWNVEFNDQDEAAAFSERLKEIAETENIPKHRLLTALPELLYGKALLWYRSNKGFWNNWETFKETFRMASILYTIRRIWNWKLAVEYRDVLSLLLIISLTYRFLYADMEDNPWNKKSSDYIETYCGVSAIYTKNRFLGHTLPGFQDYGV
ncbi:hypothetical protein JTB14_023043 [Gonioctena quinquepunctata]|nr:hypothetical protein JTB14_023043 [Gonioctena quinquepunctata]